MNYMWVLSREAHRLLLAVLILLKIRGHVLGRVLLLLGTRSIAIIEDSCLPNCKGWCSFYWCCHSALEFSTLLKHLFGGLQSDEAVLSCKNKSSESTLALSDEELMGLT